MSMVPSELKYTKEHEWVKENLPSESTSSSQQVRIGITDFAQEALGDIVYIQLPKIGQKVQAGAVCGEVESTKSVSEIFAPVSGVVTAINSGLDANPEFINSDPYGAGWIADIELSEPASDLMTPSEYESLTA
jgi:glycine cleavage system H protein